MLLKNKNKKKTKSEKLVKEKKELLTFYRPIKALQL